MPWFTLPKFLVISWWLMLIVGDPFVGENPLPGDINYLAPYSLETVQLSPTTYTGNLNGVDIGEVGLLPARWHIAQWGAPVDLAATIDNEGNAFDGDWQTFGDGNNTVRAHDGILEFVEDTNDPTPGCGEFDLFAEVNDPITYPSAEPGFNTPYSIRSSLADESALWLQASQGITEAVQRSRCQPGYDLATTTISLVLLNTSSHQAMFYQVMTYDSRGYYFNGSWFFTGADGHVWGVADTVDVLGSPSLVPGGTTQLYQLEVGQRINTLIATRPELDQDLSHWKVAGIYAGSATNGNARIVSTIGNIALKGVSK